MAAHHPGSTTSRPVSAGVPASPGRELVLQTIARHGSSLLATARRYSLCADDAQDAYQRGLEIFLRHADGLRPDGAAAWLRTVVKHEALAVRAARLRLVSPGEPDLDLYEAGDAPPADERAASLERLGRSAEALAQLKPQEVRALVLKAHGYSYLEICRITGWTYTKVNRCLTEGRQSLRERLRDIEAGRQCRRWEPALSAAAEGRASAQELISLQLHLRGCGACRASLRAGRMARRAPAPLAARRAAASTDTRPQENP
jgi:RNA polymerase sigma factor (sigma-70 family)